MPCKAPSLPVREGAWGRERGGWGSEGFLHPASRHRLRGPRGHQDPRARPAVVHQPVRLVPGQRRRLGDRSSLNTFQSAFGELPPAVPSFPAGLPLLALDRIIANRKGIITEVEAHDTPLARIASDHLPIKALVNLKTVGR